MFKNKLKLIFYLNHVSPNHQSAGAGECLKKGRFYKKYNVSKKLLNPTDILV